MTGDSSLDASQTSLPISAIVVGERHRKALGDLTELAASLASIGLLHAVVVTPTHQLVAGARRLAAAQQLGWQEIPVRVLDLPSLLRAEHDENMLRQPFLPTEAVAVGRALEAEIATQNAAKRREAGRRGGQTAGRGRAKGAASPLTNNHTPVHETTTRAQVGKAVGMSGTSYTKAKAVVLAAEEAPERYGDLVMGMDATGSVERAYQTMQRRRASDALPGKSPHQLADEDPARRWTESLHKLYVLMKSVETYSEGLSNLTRQWKPELRQQYARELTRIQAVLGQWVQALEEVDHHERT